MSPTLPQATFAAVLLLANRMQTTYDARLGDLTLKQWVALVVVRSLPQPVPSTAMVVDVLGTSHQNVAKLLASLARKGYLDIAPSPTDARARQITLTEQAEQYFTRHADYGDTLLGELFAGIPDHDLATCLRVLEAMSRSLTGLGLTPDRIVR